MIALAECLVESFDFGSELVEHLFEGIVGVVAGEAVEPFVGG